MKKIIHVLILFILTVLLLFVVFPLVLSSTLSQVTEQQSQTKIHRTALVQVWELRKDLQFYFPDKKNGVDKMEGWTLLQWAEKIGYKEYTSLKQYNEEAEKEYIYAKYKDIERALNKIASREYVLDEYDCKHFSIDLQNELANAGISSVLVTGFSKTEGHRWVAIEVEPTTGEITYFNENVYKYPTQMLTSNKSTVLNNN